MTENPDTQPLIEFEGGVRLDYYSPPTEFTLMAHDETEARALAIERYGDHPTLSVWKKEPPEPRVLKEYVVVLYDSNHQPSESHTLMAHDSGEALALAKERFGDVRMSVWNEEASHERR